MIRLILSAGVFALLAACTNMGGTISSTNSSASSGAEPDTMTMGGPGGLRHGGPTGSAGGGPN